LTRLTLGSGVGVNTQKPLHALRKEYGSVINKAHGIHAASKALRHADINVTNNFTSPGSTGSRRRRVSVPNGHFTHGLYGNRMGPTYGGETVAVFGCGPVGLMAQKVAQVKGARKVVGIDWEAYRLAIPDRVAEAETSTLKKRTRLSGSEK
jgi:glutamate dehydrogenase/leucine dehydrogenase